MFNDFSLKIEVELFTAVLQTFPIRSLALTIPECIFPLAYPGQNCYFSDRYFPGG